MAPIMPRLAITLALVVVALLWLPELAFAQTLPETGLSEFAAQAGFGGTADVRLIIARLVRTVLSLVGIVLLIMVIYGGFLWMIAGGAQEKIKKARDTIVHAVAGLVIVLSAFAITQFVVMSLVGATGASSSVSDSAGGPGVPGCPTCPVDYSSSFVTESWGCLETLSVLPQNAVVQVLFNRTVQTNPSVLEDFITVKAGSSAVDVKRSGSGQIVTVSANASTCPSEAGDVFCPGTTYTVSVGEGFLSADGIAVECTIYNPCSYTFTTGNVIDNAGPSVVLNAPPNGSPVFSFIPLDLQASVTDDSGVGVTDFTVGSVYVDSAEPSACTGDGPMSCLANGLWAPGNLTPGSSHVIRASASDCSGNAATSAPVTVTALAPHCASTFQDEDETGVDCGGADCLACSGASCVEASDCASFLCVAGECVTGPKILNVSPRGDAAGTPALAGVPNGAVGNFITISGTGFGTTPGVVTFIGASDNNGDNVNAPVVACPNPSWTDTEIVVAVPVGAASGAIQVTTGAAAPLVDSTSDAYGPFIAPFVLNDIMRPGLCGVVPASAESGDRVAIAGVNFGTDPAVGSIYFSGASVYEATFLSAIDSWTSSALSVLVPPATAGAYDLSVFVSGEGSNELAFAVTQAAASSGAPRIDYVDSGVSLCTGSILAESGLCTTDADCGGGSCVSASTTGAPGQYVSIFGAGFGSAMGTVIFADENSGDVIFVPDFPPQCSSNWWSDTMIVVQVPSDLSVSPTFNPKTIRVRSAGYPLTPESNTADFTVDDIAVSPGLCAVSPTAGPVGTPVTVYGDNLGASASDFELRFYNGSALPPSVPALSSTEVYVSNQEVGASVPSGAASGPLSAVVDVSSNTLNFTVGDCTVVEDLCSSTQVCCPSGICAANVSECAGDPVDAQYVYGFTTGPIPNVPTVIEACDGSTLSPTPSTLFEDGTSACVNANVLVAFSPGAPAAGMEEAPLENPNNVYVEHCVGNGLDPCEAVEEDAEDNSVHLAGVLSATPTTVSFDPDAPLAQNAWYRVTVTDDVVNVNDVALAGDYVFRFKTRDSATECEVEELLVSPADYTAVTSAPIDYEALPTNGLCQTLDPDDYSYDWTLTNYGRDIVFAGDVTSLAGTINEVLVLPNQETAAGQPALVNAGVVGFLAEDTEELTVNFTDPYVTEAWPQCGSACVNASVGASFNTAMTATGATGILGAHAVTSSASILTPGSENNVRIFACTNEICDTFAGGPLSAPVVFVNDPLNADDGREFYLSGSLSPSTYYRVLIWGGVESEPGPGQPNGVPLWGEVTPSGNPVEPLNYGNYYSWTFRTRADSAACGIGSVTVTPAELFLDFIGDRGAFSAEPFGEPDSCSLNGQRLNALSYPWGWVMGALENPFTSALDLIATFLPDHGDTATLDTSSASLATCTSSCLNAGSQAYAAVCGNGVLDRNAVTSAWEDCDPSAPGWSAAECTSTCQTIGVSACTATVTSSCCGNGVREGREECDDGGNVNGNGCNSACLKEGSAASGLTCGDGVISYNAATFAGEECDDSNAVSGDGCSSVCLREGSIQSSVIGGVVCGDGAIELGEDCDDGNGVSGDGCSSACLQEPLLGAWTFSSVSGVCGNGAREPVLGSPLGSGVGEECDDGNAISGDGCSFACLNEGSSIFYATPSFCGDEDLVWNAATGGEECEVTESDSVPAFDPVQYLEIEPVAAQLVEDGSVSANFQATGSDAATSTSAFGTAVIGLNCSCESDASCGNATAIGCGLNGCCFERPEVDAANTYPLVSGTNPLCRNTLAQVRFTESMDQESFFAGTNDSQPQLFLELLAAAGDWTDVNGNGLYDASLDTISSVTCPSSYAVLDIGARNRFARLFRRLARFIRPSAFAQDTACVLPAQLIPTDLDVSASLAPDLVTRVQIQYGQALEPSAVYRLVVVADGNINDATVEGVASVWNVTMNGVSGANIGPAGGYAGAWSRTFTTGTEICSVDKVLIDDLSASPGVFTAAAEAHSLTAQPVHHSGPVPEPVVEVPGLYEWSWSGFSASTDPEEPDITWGWTSSPATDAGDVLEFAPTPSIEDTPSVTLTTAAPAINGEETIRAQLRVDVVSDPSIDTVGRIASGTIQETVFLCENPWPAVANFPFADTAEFSAANTLVPPLSLSTPHTNFSFYYCRDAGEPANVSDDLPALSIVEKTDAGNAIQEPGVFKEFIFAVDDPELNDVIGVRILGNSEYQSPLEWFAAQGFVGGPSPEALDGFAGVRDGRTLYVSAPNIGPAIPPLSGTVIYPNMYVAAYNEGAAEETVEIYKRLLAQWSFAANENVATGEPIISNARVCTVSTSGGPDPVEVNGALVACTSDADCTSVPTGGPSVAFCDAQKDKLRRDFLRLGDLRTIGEALESYGDTHRHCSVTKNQACFANDDCSGTETCVASVPTLQSGTFIPSRSSSTWPSWQAQLANALGSALPTDPLNAYANCPDGYDDVSCYNALEALARCPDDSYVYNYRSIGGEFYNLEADLEYGNDVSPYAWAEPLDVFDLGDFFVGNAVLPSTNYPDTGDYGGFEEAPNCQSSAIFSAANICGDGLIGSGEFCEVGQTSTETCTVNVCTNTSDLSYNGDVCTSPADCGAGGTCAPTAGVKTVSCYAPGEPVSAPGPGCNDYQNETESDAACLPYFCGDGILDANGPDNMLGNADDEVCDDGPLNGQYGYCDASCSWADAAFCGDGTLGGSEVCDCGADVSFNALADPNVCTYPPPTGFPLLNGSYFLRQAYGCSASCNGPQAYCGDGVVNGVEVCDGEVEQWGGKLCADGTDCTVNADCSSGVCGAGAAACPVSSDGFDQVRTRICQGITTPVQDSCTWGSSVPPLPPLSGWSACTPTGSCGNGVREGTEACDDGDTDNQDGCIINSVAGVMCQVNVCGDGYRNIGVEACDLGGANGTPCDASYGGTCTYCSNTCNFLTNTGDYCGDGEVNGGEYCDGEDIPSRCYKADADPSERASGDVCEVNTDCPDSSYTCQANIGLCNGGTTSSGESFNGAPCVASNSLSCGSSLYGGSQGECIAQDCDNACGSACPFTLEQGVVQVEVEGSSSRASEVDLYSYLAGPSPDEANLFFPACTVGTQLVADVSFANVAPPQVDVLFLVDLSRSMLFDVDNHDPAINDSGFTPPDRITIVENGLLSAMSDLYDAFPFGSMQVALVGFTSPMSAPPPVNAVGTASTLQGFTSSQSEIEEAITTLLAPISATTTADGLDWAYHLLQARAADPATANRDRIVVLLTDGSPSATLLTNFSLVGPSTGSPMQDAYNVSQALQDAEGLDVNVYTGAFTSVLASLAPVAHLSSNACGTAFDSLADCLIPNDGVNYAYSAQTEVEFNAMLQDIVDNILGLNVSYLTETGSEGGAVMEGNDVVLPFPPGFACEEVSGIPQTFTIPLFVTFNSGDPLGSTVNLSNLRLQYCPFQ